MDKQHAPFEPPGEDEPQDPLEDIIAFLDREGWKVVRHGERVEIFVKSHPYPFEACFSWRENTLECACQFNLTVPGPRIDEVGKLILSVNRTLLWGHFEHRPEGRAILYRSAMPLEKGCISEGQTLRLFTESINQCMTFEKSFRQVVRGLSAGEALTSLMHMCETSGQA